MKLSDVPGIGPSKADKLATVGVSSVQDLAEVDLRALPDVGIGREVLKRAKQEARKMCDKAGIAYEKAPYGTGPRATTTKAGGPAKATKPATPATQTPAPPASKPPARNGATPRRGLLARLFKRA